MASALLIVAQDGFRDEELFETKKVLEAGGVVCKVASIERSTAKGSLGGMVMPDLAVRQTDLARFDAIIVVGGPGAPTLAKHPEVLKLLRNAKEQGKLISAICLAPAAVLAKAGVIQSKKVTGWKGDLDGMSTQTVIETIGKATFVDEHVVTDGDIVTADGPAAACGFGRAILAALRKRRPTPEQSI